MNLTKWSLVAITPAALIVLSSCSSSPQGEGATFVAAQQGVPGGVIVETYEITATVTGIEAPARKVTLVTPDGKKETVKCGPEVANFDQIQIGDQLKIKATERLAVYMAADAPPASAGEVTLVSLAPIGAKPGGLFANATQVTAKVTAIDLKKHKATLRFPDGSTQTVAVRKDVDLSKRQVGEEVVIRITESLAITVAKP
jgi:hypothetical protein